MEQPTQKSFVIMTCCLLLSGISHLMHNIAVAANYITAEHVTTGLTWLGYITGSGAAVQTWREKRLSIKKMNREKQSK